MEQQISFQSNDTEGLDKRMHLQEQEAKKLDDIKQQQIVSLHQFKNEANDRLNERIMERINIQLESQQHTLNINKKNLRDLSFQTPDEKQKRIQRKPQQNSHYLTGRAPALWNEVSKTCQKHLDLSINQNIIDKDCQGVENITNRILNYEKDENLRVILMQANMEKTRNQLKEISIKNFEFEQKVLQNRTSPPPNPSTRSILEINKIRSKSYLDQELIEQQLKEELKQQQYEDFLKQEKDHLSQINTQYEFDKKKFTEQTSHCTQQLPLSSRQNSISNYNANPKFKYSHQQNMLTFGKASNKPETLNPSLKNWLYLAKNRAYSLENRNIYHFEQSTPLNQKINDSGIKFQKSLKLGKIKSQCNSIHATPNIGAESKPHTKNSQSNGLSVLNQQNISQKKEQLSLNMKNQEQTAIFGNTCISAILEKTHNQLNKINQSINEPQAQQQKMFSSNKGITLKSSLKARSYSHNNSDIFQNNTQNQQNNIIQYDIQKQQSIFNQDSSFIQDNSINQNDSLLQDYDSYQNDKTNFNSLPENSSNQRNDITEKQEQKKEQENNKNISKNNSQIISPSHSKKVNFNKINSFQEYHKESIKQNQDSLKAIEQQFSIDVKSQSQDATNFIRSTQLSTASNYPLKYLKTPIIHKQYSHINYLSQPKQEIIPSQITDKFEYRGLLSGEVHQIDTKLNNSFVKTMMSGSKVVKDQTMSNSCFRSPNTKKRFNSSSYYGSILSEYDEGSQQKQRISNKSISYNPERDCSDQDIQKFEDENLSCDRLRGFPGKRLSEYRSTVKHIQKIKEKDKSAQLEQLNKRNYTSISPQKSQNINRIHPSFSQCQQNSRIIN